MIFQIAYIYALANPLMKCSQVLLLLNGLLSSLAFFR